MTTHAVRTSKIYHQVQQLLANPSCTPVFCHDELNAIIGKFETQLSQYEELPIVTQFVDIGLSRLIPQYSHIFDTTEDGESLAWHLGRFIKSKQDSERGKIDHLKAYIIKYELNREYTEIRELREKLLSRIEDTQVSLERVVPTYTSISLIEFVKLLHDDVFLHSGQTKYYLRLCKMFTSFSQVGGITGKLRPADVEKLIQRILYAEINFTEQQKNQVKLEHVKQLLMADLGKSGMKLSNKELFTLFDLNDNVGAESMNLVYEKFLHSDHVAKTSSFFKAYLRKVVSMNGEETSIAKRVIEDAIEHEVVFDREFFELVVKHAQETGNIALQDVVSYCLLKEYTLCNHTLSIMQGTKYTSLSSPLVTLLRRLSIPTNGTTASTMSPLNIPSIQIQLADRVGEFPSLGEFPGFCFRS